MSRLKTSTMQTLSDLSDGWAEHAAVVVVPSSKALTGLLKSVKAG